MLTTDDVVLIILEAAGGSIAGKTLLQKKIYFVSKLLLTELGYLPQVFGPYSPEVDEAVSKAIALGFVSKTQTEARTNNNEGFERNQVVYRLTDGGKNIVRRIKESESSTFFELAERASKTLSAFEIFDDYIALSVASRILDQQETGRLDIANFRSGLNRAGWHISQKTVERAIDFLQRINVYKAAAMSV